MSAARKGALACVVAAAANGAIVPECKNALDERLSGLGQIVDGDTVIDCQTLSSRGLCRFAGHLCDAACDRCGVPAHVRGGLTFVREDGSEEPLELLWYVDETIAAAAARLCVLIDSWGIRDAAPGFAALFDQPWETAERRELAARQPASWDDLRARSDLGLPVRLNVGGHEDCHPKANFWEFACVGLERRRGILVGEKLMKRRAR